MPDLAWVGPRVIRRMRRGDIRSALLTILAEGPGHGYEVISRLEEKSGGRWRPSPGSVYPTLQMLEDEGLVRSEVRDGKRVYELTDAGRAEAASRAEAGAPWEAGPNAAALFALRRATVQLQVATRQVAHLGDPAQLERARAAVRQANQELYRILSED
jgi:DNA-binding PadR family transcriptional regulator